MRPARTMLTALLLATALLATGCVGFGGPNDVRRAIAKQEDLQLDKEMAVTVGPLGIFLVNTLAGPWMPVNIDGVNWVSYGEYVAERNDHSTEPLCLRDLELPGWERVARVCDGTEDILIMVPIDTDRLRKLLFVQREENAVRIVKAEGNLEKVIDRLLESDLVDDDFITVFGGGVGGGGGGGGGRADTDADPASG